MNDDLDPDLEAFVRALLSGGLYTPPGPDKEPECELYSWQVMQVEGPWGKSHHFVGVHNHGGTGRVSSSIQSFDPVSKSGVTASSRVYRLMDDNDTKISDTRNMEYVRSAWLRRSGLMPDAYKDVTEAYKLMIANAEKDDGIAKSSVE